jgi:uracil-DNA glycosylase
MAPLFTAALKYEFCLDRMKKLLEDIRNCTLCQAHLPLGPRPIVSLHPKSKILIIGQAPGTKVHASGMPWDDASGNELRRWLAVDKETFYNDEIFALMPMGFCYPGKGTSGDLPPRPECAPQWHAKIFRHLKSHQLTLLIGQYSQAYYLGDGACDSLTETVKAYKKFLPHYLPLPHPSPRNRIWQKKNGWFEKMVVPELRVFVKKLL